MQDFQHRSELGIAGAAEGLVEALPANARLFGQARHTARPSNHAESMGNERRIIALQRVREILGNSLLGIEIFGRIERPCRSPAHQTSSLIRRARSMSASCV